MTLWRDLKPTEHGLVAGTLCGEADAGRVGDGIRGVTLDARPGCDYGYGDGGRQAGSSEGRSERRFGSAGLELF